MPTYQQLTDDVLSYLDRRDSAARLPSWVTMVETELQQTLRARVMEVTAVQAIDAAYIQLPPDFATMASIRDHSTGVLLTLKDEWSGDWSDDSGWIKANSPVPCSAYRLRSDCIELLPHPVIPATPDPSWQFQMIEMSWYAKPRPLVIPSDTNPVLEAHYAIYLYGVLSHAGVFEQDAEMVSVWDAKYQQAVTRANLHTQQSTYSGAPYTQEFSGVF